MSTCAIFENGAPVINSAGVPASRRMIAPASAYEIVDNWYTTGMRGTGSVDFCAVDLFILFEPAKREGTLWRRPTTFIAKASGVPLGAARAMIDLVSETMQSK